MLGEAVSPPPSCGQQSATEAASPRRPSPSLFSPARPSASAPAAAVSPFKIKPQLLVYVHAAVRTGALELFSPIVFHNQSSPMLAITGRNSGGGCPATTLISVGRVLCQVAGLPRFPLFLPFCCCVPDVFKRTALSALASGCFGAPATSSSSSCPGARYRPPWSAASCSAPISGRHPCLGHGVLYELLTAALSTSSIQTTEVTVARNGASRMPERPNCTVQSIFSVLDIRREPCIRGWSVFNHVHSAHWPETGPNLHHAGGEGQVQQPAGSGEVGISAAAKHMRRFF